MENSAYDVIRQKCYVEMAPICIKRLKAISAELSSEARKAHATCSELTGCSGEFLEEYLRAAAICEIFCEADRALWLVIYEAEARMHLDES